MLYAKLLNWIGALDSSTFSFIQNIAGVNCHIIVGTVADRRAVHISRTHIWTVLSVAIYEAAREETGVSCITPSREL